MRVSVLTATYNRLQVTSSHIPNICSKLGKDVELLIWDNGSEDGSADWVYEFGSVDPRVTKVFLNETNTGMMAFNEMAKEASGKYILKIDDDMNPPENFANRLADIYEKIGEDRLMYLGWDMPWPKTPKAGGDTFATRSGNLPYDGGKGKVISYPEGNVYITFDPSKWLMNGACRLCLRDRFLETGGHPDGIIYGVDYHASVRAKEHGYWIGYFSPSDLVEHCGVNDTKDYRAFKDKELRKVKSPRHV